MTTEVCSARFPHSDISGSMDICSSPKLFAAYHVFHRLLVPRHPPCALISLTSLTSAFAFGLKVYSVTLSGLWFSSFDIPFGISLGCLDIFFFEDSIFSFFQYVVFKVHVRSANHYFYIICQSINTRYFHTEWRWRDSNS